MAKKKRQVSAETRVRLSQAAKKRHRGLKGTSLGGRFLSGAAFGFGHVRPVVAPQRARYGQGHLFDNEGNWKSGKAGEESLPPKGSFEDPSRGHRQQPKDSPNTGTRTSPRQPKATRHTGPRGENPSYTREFGQAVFADQVRRAQSHPGEVAADATRMTLERHLEVPVSKDEFVGANPTISRARRQADDQHKKAHWQDEGVYATTQTKTPARFAREDMDPDHKAEFDRLRNDPSSPFNRSPEGLPSEPGSSRSRNRQRQYTDKLQEGWSHEAALSHVQNLDERRGRPAGATSQGRSTVRDRKQARSRKGQTRGSKFENVNDQYRGKKDMEFGVDLQAADRLQDLSNRYPDASDRELLRIQQEDRMALQDEFEKNLLWAHETKRANMMGENADQHGRKSKEQDDRVVFFTTNLGSPAPSVPADSLIGQYVIRRRKKMMKDTGYSDASLRGEFPRAVRDVHLLELSTGISLGVEGRAGVYNETGFRKGTKTSKGYNKPTPLGTHMVTDASGNAVYDTQGNVRYSEGATRPVNWQSPRAGLKIFIG